MIIRGIHEAISATGKHGECKPKAQSSWFSRVGFFVIAGLLRYMPRERGWLELVTQRYYKDWGKAYTDRLHNLEPEIQPLLVTKTPFSCFWMSDSHITRTNHHFWEDRMPNPDELEKA